MTSRSPRHVEREKTLKRLAFFGTPATAAATLVALIDAGHEIAVVVTNPDRRRARRGEIEPNPVKLLAKAHAIPVREHPSDVLEFPCDLGVVVAYGQLIRTDVLARLPMVNIHFSLLPRWRGAAPVERAILAGDQVTGVCLMRLEEGLDTGAVYARATTAIDPDEGLVSLRERLSSLGTALLLEELGLGDAAFAHAVLQTGEVNYAHKIGVEDRHLDFSEPAVIAQRKIRVGRAWTTFRGRRIVIHEARVRDGHEGATGGHPGLIVADHVLCSAGLLVPLVVQAEGRSRMDFATWLAGVRLKEGESFEP
ncbi:MAG TPA: methionyl-tRNA formyltransferase [Acidimicrobiales bacterium]|nr:methionyl-tRNA formyltransferase [Acidimicrobiales bacterium]